ncbi:unnamed protein product [Nippostrongylus brasiliensis]|uniref:DUF4258 domain-containing protein n=1 Tax=Nippostrongylus brasiliensis TaxID=27835 RepID=A0A0N4Y7S7_NIPBR|nr:unnamed protein product [Nippostrongylus brasiliensis]
MARKDSKTRLARSKSAARPRPHHTGRDLTRRPYEITTVVLGATKIIDASGSRDFLAMRHFYIRTGDAFLVVFSIDDAHSLEEAKRIIEEIEQERNKKVFR